MHLKTERFWQDLAHSQIWSHKRIVLFSTPASIFPYSKLWLTAAYSRAIAVVLCVWQVFLEEVLALLLLEIECVRAGSWESVFCKREWLRWLQSVPSNVGIQVFLTNPSQEQQFWNNLLCRQCKMSSFQEKSKFSSGPKKVQKTLTSTSNSSERALLEAKAQKAQLFALYGKSGITEKDARILVKMHLKTERFWQDLSHSQIWSQEMVVLFSTPASIFPYQNVTDCSRD